MRSPVENLEAAIGYRFTNRELLHRALTHSSWIHENSECEGLPADNEQLEFLGDSILGFLISENLIHRFPSYPEGALSKLRAHLVSADYLQTVARTIRLGEYLELGRGEELSGGRSKKTLIVDALEAVIAAMYLDGGAEAVRPFVLEHVVAASELGTNGLPDRLLMPQTDFKSELQELAQANRLPAPRYFIAREQGPEHSKVFTMEVRIGRETVGQAEGVSKKNAAQNAAREGITRLRELIAARAAAPPA